MSHHATLSKRQLWEVAEENDPVDHCTPFALPANGTLTWGNTTITIPTEAWFQPECNARPGTNPIVPDLNVPFYASTIPQTYVIAATTVIAWILVIMLIIAPRTSFAGSSNMVPYITGGHGLIGGASGGRTNLIGVGSRPWLQKVAAITVAVSLTITTSEMLKTAQEQYTVWYPDATDLREAVLQSNDIKISRVVSDIFIWLAQVQTLIRLFPRHKEKVLIKWIGFALILLDTLFSCLNSFVVDGRHRPRQFANAIPALSYLFELALELLYAAWVVYYALTKRRYAFWHPKMYNVSLIALLSLVAVLTPVVFFVIDVANQEVAGWGDYVRWVGAAAAAVVVWEWVERIEALEQDERKDGILGRELFDGDDMLDTCPNGQVTWGRKRQGSKADRRKDDHDEGDDHRDGDGSGGAATQRNAFAAGLMNVGRRIRRRPDRPQRQHLPLGRAHSGNVATRGRESAANDARSRSGELLSESPRDDGLVIGGPPPPAAVASPVSRAETVSAASTVYVVRYHPVQDGPQPVRRRGDVVSCVDRPSQPAPLPLAQAESNVKTNQGSGSAAVNDDEGDVADDRVLPNRDRRPAGRWLAVNNPFKRKRASPPPEVQEAARRSNIGPQAMTSSTTAAAPFVPATSATHKHRATTPPHSFSRWDVKSRLGVLAAETGERLRERRTTRPPGSDLPVTIIPPQPKGSGRTWSPKHQALVDQCHQSDDSVVKAAKIPASIQADASPGQRSGSTTLQGDSHTQRTVGDVWNVASVHQPLDQDAHDERNLSHSSRPNSDQRPQTPHTTTAAQPQPRPSQPSSLTVPHTVTQTRSSPLPHCLTLLPPRPQSSLPMTQETETKARLLRLPLDGPHLLRLVSRLTDERTGSPSR